MNTRTGTYSHGIGMMMLISLIYPIGFAAPILAPMIVGGSIDGYGFTEQQAGNLSAMEGLGLVIASLGASFWIHRHSWRIASSAGLLLYVALNVISAQITDVFTLTVLRFLTGAAGGTVAAVAVAGLGDNKQPDRAFGVAQVVQGVVMFGAFAIAPMLLMSYGLGGLFYMLAAAGAVALVLVPRIPRQGAERILEEHNEDLGFKHKALVFMGLAGSFLYFVSFFGLWAFIERIGGNAGVSPENIGLALGVSQLAAIAGAGLAAVAGDKFGRTLPMLITLIGQGIVIWLLMGQFSTPIFFFAACLIQGIFFLSNSYQMGIISKIDVRGNLLVLITGFQGLGAAFGPGIAGGLVSENDYSGIFSMSGITLVVSIAVFLFIIMRTRALVATSAVTTP